MLLVRAMWRRFARHWSSSDIVICSIRASTLLYWNLAYFTLSASWHRSASVRQLFCSFQSFPELHIWHWHWFWYWIDVAQVDQGWICHLGTIWFCHQIVSSVWPWWQLMPERKISFHLTVHFPSLISCIWYQGRLVHLSYRGLASNPSTMTLFQDMRSALSHSPALGTLGFRRETMSMIACFLRVLTLFEVIRSLSYGSDRIHLDRRSFRRLMISHTWNRMSTIPSWYW